MVVDIGGGSTELVVADRGAVVFRRSLPLGSVRLHERHIKGDPPSPGEASALEAEVGAILDQAPEAFDGPPLAALVGVAGTVTSLAAMALRLDAYDPARVHGARLALTDIDAQVRRLQEATQAQREQMVGLDPRRADVIFAGALLLRCLVRRAGLEVVRVSDRGIKWGLFHERVTVMGPLGGSPSPPATGS
jgi:exopolyphosphatase/guanosine-5'-triphosphate,3'-diphosphate pyrophosphatase